MWCSFSIFFSVLGGILCRFLKPNIVCMTTVQLIFWANWQLYKCWYTVTLHQFYLFDRIRKRELLWLFWQFSAGVLMIQISVSSVSFTGKTSFRTPLRSLVSLISLISEHCHDMSCFSMSLIRLCLFLRFETSIGENQIGITLDKRIWGGSIGYSWLQFAQPDKILK